MVRFIIYYKFIFRLLLEDTLELNTIKYIKIGKNIIKISKQE